MTRRHVQTLYTRVAAWAHAVRDAYVGLLPLTFLGVMATLALHLPVPGGERSAAQLAGPAVERFTQQLLTASQGLLGLALAVMLSVQIGRRLRAGEAGAPQAPWLALAALVNFVLCLAARGEYSTSALGHGSTALGLLVGSYTPCLMAVLMRLPMAGPARTYGHADQVFAGGIQHVTPLIGGAVLTLLGATLLPALTAHLFAAWWPPLPALSTWTDSGTLLSATAVLVNQLLWGLGIHGGKLVDSWFQGSFVPDGSAFDPTRVWRPLVDNFVHLGGSGATWGLALACLWAVRSGPVRRLARVSVVPSLFNVNELLVYGLPVVLHPRLLLPFIGVPVALTLGTLALVHAGWMPVQPRPIHWTTPVLVSGWLLTGSWVGVAWQALAVAFSTACYLPMVRRVEAERQAEERRAVVEGCDAILAARGRHRQALRQPDAVGDLARSLLADLRDDLHTPAVSLMYQPKHDVDGRATGVEALLRWTHGRLGPMRADVAVTLAEDGGLVSALGRRVLDEACARKAAWNPHGLGAMTMAVNVSPIQLSEPGFAATVAQTLQRHGLPPEQLELEITESQAIPLDGALDENMQQLQALGVRVAMDDFGMGHSSLVHLRRLHVHAIKIDGSITREVLARAASADIVRSIASLAESRGLQVVAEFVETVEQQALLAQLGCTHFQGYLHAPPLKPDRCRDHLLAHRAVTAPAALAPLDNAGQPSACHATS